MQIATCHQVWYHRHMTRSESQIDPARADRLAYYLLKAVNKANRHYHLLADGDTILVAVSGGKDSLTALDLLHRRRRRARERYSLVVGRVRSDHSCGKAVSEDWLADYCRERDIPLVIEPLAIAEELATTEASKCYRCAWNRRKVLFQLADRLGCNKLAFGHHARIDWAATNWPLATMPMISPRRR
jgi:tRNA(Ile)-lysidine synthase TilS/MesJ